MMGQPTKPKETGVFRGVAPTIGLFIGLVPAMAQAQTNIDQGKSPAEIFATDCATCHKSARGLANGRGSSGLASFLAEHYTASKDQAAALAAYVMGAGGGEAAPTTATRGLRPAATTAPAPDRNRASAEEPKSAGPPPRTPGRPDQAPSTSAKLRPPEEKPGGSPSTTSSSPTNPATASRNRRNEPQPAPPAQPPAIVAEPAPPSSPSVQENSPVVTPGPSAAAPATPEPGDNAPVPRDNIPD
jgi:mono/diheme cytochrome c family protein